MPDKITVLGAAAGAQGAVFRRIVATLAKTPGNYVVTDTNFPGIGQYLPCRAIIAINPAATSVCTIQVSSDNGTTWFTLWTAAAATQFGGYVMLDTANTIRITVTTANADIRFFVE